MTQIFLPTIHIMAYVEAAITYSPGLNCVFCMGHFRPILSSLWNGSKCRILKAGGSRYTIVIMDVE